MTDRLAFLAFKTAMILDCANSQYVIASRRSAVQLSTCQWFVGKSKTEDQQTIDTTQQFDMVLYYLQ
jgi:hypothetical protein